jgi:tetratricopeptide (TPR) repeat protein
MALLKYKQAKWEDSLEMYQKVLTIYTAAFGPDHSKVRDTYTNMAMVLRQQEKLDGALEMYRQALPPTEAAVSPDSSMRSAGDTYGARFETKVLQSRILFSKRIVFKDFIVNWNEDNISNVVEPEAKYCYIPEEDYFRTHDVR